ncbi:MAG: nucleotidyl transferase AbiEii/AbiGii toxin family protein [Thermoplasmatota archaeon]
MNRNELARFIGATGFSLGQVEKDYFQHIALSSLSRNSAPSLVFKGGTALQKMGYTDRFSEDLDFTAENAIDIERIMKDTVDSISRYNFLCSPDKIREGEDSSGFRLMIEGPLFRSRKGICAISFDISTRENVVLKPDVREYSPPYPDVSPYLLITMDPSEILAEKIRALMTRRRPRDLFDACRLLERGLVIDKGLVSRKLDHYGIALDEETIVRRASELDRRWELELKQLLGSVPDHGACMAIIDRAINGES